MFLASGTLVFYYKFIYLIFRLRHQEISDHLDEKSRSPADERFSFCSDNAQVTSIYQIRTGSSWLS